MEGLVEVSFEGTGQGEKQLFAYFRKQRLIALSSAGLITAQSNEFNTLYPNISKLILHTTLRTFLRG